MDRSVEILCEHLKRAAQPEDIFGAIADGALDDRLTMLRHRFNEFVRLIHPDKNPGLKDAGQHMQRLTTLRHEAETCLKADTYGKARRVVHGVLRSRLGAYTVLGVHRVGEVADLFMAETEAGKRCLLKVARQPSDNDLLDIEARTLRELHAKTDEKSRFFQRYLPLLSDAFPLIEAGKHRRVNVLDLAEGFFSLAEIRTAYPGGLDARDVAWMLRRCLEVLGWVHVSGLVHGAVLPEHLLVHPTDHGAKLIGWSYSVQAGQRITAISAQRASMYPASVRNREPATPVVDVKLLGQTAALMMSDERGRLRSDVPAQVATFVSACKTGKFKEAWEAYHEYNGVLTKCYGKRVYRALAMPRV